MHVVVLILPVHGASTTILDSMTGLKIHKTWSDSKM